MENSLPQKVILCVCLIKGFFSLHETKSTLVSNPINETLS